MAGDDGRVVRQVWKRLDGDIRAHVVPDDLDEVRGG